MYYARFGIRPFLDDDDWQFCLEAEAILKSSKVMVILVQTEKKFIAAFGPVMRKNLHNEYTSNTMYLIHLDEWKDQIHPPRRQVPVDDFSDNGRECRKRALLEVERRFFGNNTEEVFEEDAQEAVLKLKQRGKATLVLDKRTCYRRSIMHTEEEWKDACAALRVFYIEFYVQCKAYDRAAAGPQETVEVDNNSSSSDDSDDDNDFVRGSGATPVRPTVARTDMTEENLLETDAEVGGEEFDVVIKEWTGFKISWRKKFSSEELGGYCHADGEGIDPFKHLMNLPVPKMMSILECENKNGRFGYLLDMCKNSRCQLGALLSQSFAERMNSNANLLVTKNRTLLDDELIDMLVVLRMNKEFMELVRKRVAQTYFNLVDD